MKSSPRSCTTIQRSVSPSPEALLPVMAVRRALYGVLLLFCGIAAIFADSAAIIYSTTAVISGGGVAIYGDLAAICW